MALDRQTLERMRELFGGRRCCQCNEAAARLMEDRYYCHAHFLSARRGHKRLPGKRAPRQAALRLLAGEDRALQQVRCLETEAVDGAGVGRGEVSSPSSLPNRG